MSPSQRLLALAGLGAALAALSSPARADRILLSGGAEIKGEVIKEKPDGLVVDLGFTVVTVPTASIVSREKDEPPKVDGTGPARPPAETVDAEALFARAPDLKESSVAQNVKRFGEGVVLVRTPGGLGSGFIIHEDGYVVTNCHVIENERKISVTIFLKREK